MNTYKLLSATSIQRQSDSACIPTDPANSDYQLFLTEQEAGATVIPMDVPNPNAAILSQISALESGSFLNRGSRELELELMEEKAAAIAVAPETAETVLAKHPYYVKLKALDNQARTLRSQLK